MEKWSRLSELSVISWVPAVEGCPLSGVPLYAYMQKTQVIAEKRPTNKKDAV